MTGLRARVRAELTAEITRLARQQIARDGAPNLSLRAIARDLGMASSAIYRYFPSRDHLLTALIIESYVEVGEAVERAEAMVPRDDLEGRWRAVCHALRQWALAHPADYGLIFGTPVPGYAAPPDTIGPATRYTAVLVTLLRDLHAAGHVPIKSPQIGTALRQQYEVLRSRLGMDVGDELLLVGLSAWTNVFGAISFELFGHLHNVIDEPEAHFTAMVELLGDRIVGRSGTFASPPTSNGA
jgi:AcrR family transcriptional regulator